MATYTVKLTFRGPVHFGGGRLSGSECTCDASTLFSALYIEALRCGCADGLLEAVESGELVISDAFPFIDERFYVPKPMVEVGRENRGLESRDSRARKANKALKFIPSDKLRDYLNGAFNFIEELDRFETGASFLRTKVNLLRESSDDAEPYHVGGYRFAKGCGIYFLARGSYSLTPLLESLSYSGIGGKRSVGYGRFSFDVIDGVPFSLAGVESGKRAMLLSSSLPCEDELDDGLLKGARYRLVRKSGFVQSATYAPSPRKKRDMWLFAPGSVFSRCFEGGVFDVNATAGAHPVYRYARAMWMEV